MSLYEKILSRRRKEISSLGSSDGEATKTALSLILDLKKLCNHPQLIYEKCRNNEPGFEGLRCYS